MVAKVQKWGNSQGLRLPKYVLESAGIAIGDDVEVIPQEGQIFIKKVSKRKFDLAEMVSRMPVRIKCMKKDLACQLARKKGKWQDMFLAKVILLPSHLILNPDTNKRGDGPHL